MRVGHWTVMKRNSESHQMRTMTTQISYIKLTYTEAVRNGSVYVILAAGCLTHAHDTYIS